MNVAPDSLWFYTESGQQKGPVPFSELQQKIASGQLPSSSLVWTEGMPDWIPAHNVPELTAADSANPYSAPATNASLSPEIAPDDGIPANPIPLDIGFCLGQGWKHTFANFGMIILLGLIYFGISMGIGMVFGIGKIPFGDPITINPETGQPGDPNIAGIIYQVITSIIQQLISIFLSLGVARIGLDLLAGKPLQFGDLFSQGKKFLPAVGASILFGLMALVGFLLFIIPGVIVIIRFGYYLQAMVEKNLGAVDSLKYSWNLTRGNSWPILGLIILLLLVNLVGALPCFLGLIITIPVTWLAGLVAYRHLHAGPRSIKVLP